MSGIGATPVDGTSGGGIPLSCVESPGNTGQTSGGSIIPVPLMGHDGSYLDSSQNPTTAAMVGYLFPRIVQKGHNVTGSAGKTLTFAFTNNNNFGNSIVVLLGMGEVEGANITLAVTDSASNTYTKASSASQSTTLEAAIFYATNIAAGANTVTITISGSSSSNTAIACEVYEVYGPIQLIGTLDQTNTGSAASGTAVTTGAIVPIVPNEFAFMAVAAAGGTVTAGTNWISDTGGALSPTGGGLVSFEAQSQMLTTFGSVTPSATLGASNAWAACCATFHTIIVPISGPINIAQYGGSATSLGSKTSANSMPVVVASDQSAIAMGVVSGTALAADQTNTILKASLYVKKTTAGDTVLVLGSATSANSVPVVVASDQGAIPAQLQVGTSGGSTPYHNVVSSGTNGTNVKNSAGQVYDGVISNTSSSAVYFRFYDSSSSPTVGTTTVKRTIQVPGNGTVIFSWPNGLKFTNGISWGMTTGVADNDTTAISSAVSVDFGYN